jgi:hypothetical protein
MYRKTEYGKEAIRNRMYRTAAGVCGVRDVESLDPLIRLLIEALASETGKLSDEMENMEIRLLERLAGILTPDMLTRATPASMIIRARPTEDIFTVTGSTCFSYRKQVAGDYIHFYPVDNFRLINGEVQSIVCAGKLYRTDNLGIKEIYDSDRKLTVMYPRVLWVGLRLHGSVTQIRDIAFYFDLPNTTGENGLLHLLPYSLWEHRGRRLSVRSGISPADGHENGTAIASSAFDSARFFDMDILNGFNYRFVTLTDCIDGKKDNFEPLPKELDGFFTRLIQDGELPPLLWIKITLPPGFDSDIMEDFSVSINAFPVVNRKKYSKYHKTSSVIPVIPLPVDENEYFHFVESVSDSHGRLYMSLPLRDTEGNGHCGTYAVRQGGAERFDSRNAKESLSNLMNILREESASFATLGKEFINDVIRRIDSELNRIDARIKKTYIGREAPAYAVIDSGSTGNAGEGIYIDYCAVNCEHANGIKPGARPAISGDAGIDRDSVVALTASSGGKRRPESTPDMYRYALSCRDAIYTDMDIVGFCYAEAGDALDCVSVKKGVMVSPRPAEGLIRTIDVYLTLKDETADSAAKRQETEERLLKLLKRKSPQMYSYRIFITNKS